MDPGGRRFRPALGIGPLGAVLAASALVLGSAAAVESGLRVALASQPQELPPVAAGPALLGVDEQEPEIHVFSSVYIPFQCRDGLDNDGDGLVDHPDDPGCVDADDLAEHDPVPPPSGSVHFQGLGRLPGEVSKAVDVSHDGSLVVGLGSPGNFLHGTTALRWENGVLEALSLGELAASTVRSLRVSGDGRVIVGNGWDTVFFNRAFRWEEGVVTEIEPVGGEAQAAAVSDDGSVIVGSVGQSSPFPRVPARWDDGVPSILDFVPGTGVGDRAWSVSGDGAVVFAVDDDQLVQWIGSHPIALQIGPDPDARVSPVATSGEGSVLVGQVGRHAFRWKDGVTTILAEGFPGPLAVAALDVSSDGALAVGLGPSIWDASDHMRNVTDLLVNDYGIDLGGWRLRPAYAISGDGRTIVGWGENPDAEVEGWILRLPPPCSDGLDNDGDGLIDAGRDPDCRGLAWLAEAPSCGRADGATCRARGGPGRRRR